MGDLICWNCGRATGIEGKVTRNDACPHCQVDLRCCRGCRHFDPASHFQCRESVDAPIPIKDKSNFCDWFQTRLAVHAPGGKIAPADDKDTRKKRFDDLFND